VCLFCGFFCVSASNANSILLLIRFLKTPRMISTLEGSNHQISEEERMVRNHEMELLAKISAPPERDDTHLENLVKNHKGFVP